MADDFVRIEIARSHAYRGAVSIGRDQSALARDAAATWLSASDAFTSTAHDNLIIHGGTGFTWEADCHLYVRRAATLSRALGRASYWEERLIDQLQAARSAIGERTKHGS